MNIDFNKDNGLVPVIIQDDRTLQVLMLGYMNQEAFEKTKQEKVVTFYSRSKNRLWTKGEESGNFLTVKSIDIDCDQDTILIKATPTNVVCHTGSFSCFGEKDSKGFLYELEEKVSQRIDNKTEGSYTYSLYQKGINKMAQKVGEEAVEVVIEAKDNNAELFKNEAADLMYHFLILLKAKGFSLQDIEEVLRDRDR
ncbi:bifunctional phosphoribosyl-AMP cyclohydrolase/phosphoribosyl-ATP diphosphatase [Chryseobacterium lactis]|uniref:Histidine biosynthesis bifunctional protein HisIE n=1 Tax=Chryseobacterium lactis TaxID=1241981 RepID=A0A3G6RI69_CHRLC|nr:bifunctional phosphoribosyl-AMP cyclohydrolase/phosphoribosyl-ATP diphosphatase HisIE [Chryseobacterium lactis]AZA83524.1 bifunctional phosphoribosyl-AMP cyclohydrolase/phosphoribosyl-ATP diphosphatase HisIE [Chryseobacterium lactis]AZB03908.1 bifunctional phosphoribosyl-AMP cyclohydrolase/phosphoribosyl-ATP diphosphatase HisIE [Chryseobacterium lactis]PNW13182.1 bifunctional phosphoribosyl-AMP cyclohydrolase/phosphoribosyl-ATP diphosphatase [Chryseobacterium lactis]